MRYNGIKIEKTSKITFDTRNSRLKFMIEMAISLLVEILQYFQNHDLNISKIKEALFGNERTIPD